MLRSRFFLWSQEIQTHGVQGRSLPSLETHEDLGDLCGTHKIGERPLLSAFNGITDVFTVMLALPLEERLFHSQANLEQRSLLILGALISGLQLFQGLTLMSFGKHVTSQGRGLNSAVFLLIIIFWAPDFGYNYKCESNWVIVQCVAIFAWSLLIYHFINDKFLV